MKLWTSMLLMWSLALLPIFSQPYRYSDEQTFKHAVVEHLHHGTERELIEDFRKHFELQPEDSVTVDFAAREVEPQIDRVEILPVRRGPLISLGCVVIVIVVAVISDGVVIYVIYTLCKPAKPPSRLPPAPPATNPPAPAYPIHQGPNTFYRAAAPNSRTP